MKIICSIAVFVFTISIASFGQDDATTQTHFSYLLHHPEELPYNQRKHSDKKQAKVVAGSYMVMLKYLSHDGLSQSQKHDIYTAVLESYKDNKCDQPLEEAAAIHKILNEKLLSILTQSQYLVYRDFKKYPELLFAWGH